MIVGGGLAGLAAASHLSARGYVVTVLEQATHLGGRLLASYCPEGPSDAWPPVLMGHQAATLALLDEVGTRMRVAFSNSLCLEFQLSDGRLACLMQPWLPAPLHMIAGLILFSGLPWRDRWRLLEGLERHWKGDPRLLHDLEDVTAHDWLVELGLSKRARAQIWSPLARFLVGNDLTVRSAEIFVSTLARCFWESRRHTRLAVPSDSMQTLLIKPLTALLAQRGVRLELNTAAVFLEADGEWVPGTRLRDGRTLTADWYIVALPPIS